MRSSASAPDTVPPVQAGGTVSLDSLDWTALDRLRELFLSGTAGAADYWTSRSDLASYDLTYAQRIGWKWDAVLRELQARGWTPPAGASVLDWGCGSGIAGRCLVDAFGAGAFQQLHVYDRSPLAMEFAIGRARDRFSTLRSSPADPVWLGGEERVGVLLLSHVLNELGEEGGRALRRVIDRADAVLWVEPGTHADSRALIAVREELLKHFEVIAPCTQQGACGLLAAGNERHWCHHFAEAPPGVMADPRWVRFAHRAGIDLRRVPYSFLVLERRGLRQPVPGLLGEGWSRVLGNARVYKGFAKVLGCGKEGVRELELQKRVAPRVFKQLKDGSGGVVWRWSVEEGRIVALEGLVDGRLPRQ